MPDTTQKETGDAITSYQEWAETVGARIRAEPIWAFVAYRKALFLTTWPGQIVAVC